MKNKYCKSKDVISWLKKKGTKKKLAKKESEN